MATKIFEIEKLRQRAKDNKGKNVEYFLTHSYSTLDSFRNLLITLSVLGFGFYQSNSSIDTSRIYVLSSLFISVLFGMLNYIFSYLSNMYEANYYSQIERIFAEIAYPTRSEYENMIKRENDERLKKNNLCWPISIILLFLQSLFILIALINII